MRILYASERPPYPFFLGGAARSAHQLLQVMALDLGVACAAVGSSDYQVTAWAFPEAAEHADLGIHGHQLDPVNVHVGTVDCGYPVHVIADFAASLGGFIDAFRPDVVWAQLEGAHEVLQTARTRGVRGLLFVHDAEFDPAELRTIAAQGCHVVCSSGFLAHKVSKVIGRPAQVVYPPAVRYDDTPADPHGYVTMINPHRVKGLETFLDIAGRLPATRFLLLESWKLGDDALAALQAQLAKLPNVRFERRVTDMRAIYRQTRLLLVPSRWEEGFGMVAIEAQSCGIPVIASARGGLPESVGDGGILIDDYQNTDAWLGAIDQVLDNAEQYRTLSARARRHASSDEFAPAALARRLCGICANEAPGTGIIARALFACRNRIEQLPIVGRVLRRTSPL
jgi:glycosyltransferase involved in cell wall biosynthesis